MRNTLLLCTGALLLAGSAAAQKPQYLDVMVVKMRPEKRAQFDSVAKRFADANRRNGGDRWIAESAEYGEQGVVVFVSPRSNYSDIDKGNDMFEGAVNKAYGQAGMAKLMQEFGDSISGSRGEVRKLMWDLSSDVPDDPVEMSKQVGNARYVMTTAIHIRAGKWMDYEEQLKTIKAAADKSPRKHPVRIAKSGIGAHGMTYYVTMFAAKLGEFDELPTVRDLLGEEGYTAYERILADTCTGMDNAVYRMRPEWSNAEKDIAAAAPAFWNPKPAAMPMAKPKPKAEPAKPQ